MKENLLDDMVLKAEVTEEEEEEENLDPKMHQYKQCKDIKYQEIILTNIESFSLFRVLYSLYNVHNINRSVLYQFYFLRHNIMYIDK